MKQQIHAAFLSHKDPFEDSAAAPFAPEYVSSVWNFHKSFPEYQPTPLVNLKNLAQSLGISSFHVKDESFRFGLNAFKILGGSYCIGKYIAQKLNIPVNEITYETLINPDIREKLGNITFVTATDGNHGRGIAWTANRLKQKCVVYMPKGSSKERLDNILALGADASITNLNYDDTVRLAHEHAKKYGWILVQDTAWDGYETIPSWIMQGYTTMAQEAIEQLHHQSPTHIFLQAGVGAMAGGLSGFFAELYKESKRPFITIVEPNGADCIYQTAYADDGTLHNVTGDLKTIMAGLSCGEPCSIGWNILKNHADCFVSIPDCIAAKGMRILGNPLKDDPRIISGESGAATVGFVAELLQNPELAELKHKLNLNQDSKILCFSTEGDTDKEHYRKVVWNGLYPNES